MSTKKQRRRKAKGKLLVHSMKASASMRMEGMTDTQVAESIRGTSDFLKSDLWKELKAKVLEKYGAKCMCCGYAPTNLAYINVDHIKPRKFFPELAADFDNLQVLCGRCNKDKGNCHMTDYR